MLGLWPLLASQPHVESRNGRAWRPGYFADLEGKIAEVVYLPGAIGNSGLVEIRLQSSQQYTLIRLAPTGFLKASGLLLREGDVVTVKGFPVSGMEGDLILATEVHKGEKTLSLRDASGRPAW